MADRAATPASDRPKRKSLRFIPVLICLLMIATGMHDAMAEGPGASGFLASWWATASIRTGMSARRRRRCRRLRPTRGGTGQDRDLAEWRADLHDGPAQHLAYALMYLDELAPDGALETDRRREAFLRVKLALGAALEETRQLASGTNLPALRRLDPASVIAAAIRSHEAQTRTIVARRISGLPASLSQAAKVCLFRFAQEGLNNAYRHARGQGQRLSVEVSGNQIVAEVADEGPADAATIGRPERLGLIGLRRRAEAAGGKLELVLEPGMGARLRMHLPAAGSDTPARGQGGGNA